MSDVSVDDQLLAELGRLEELRRLRVPDVPLPEPGKGWCDVSSNDYLGLAGLSVSRETAGALTRIPAGSGASRLIYGTRHEHLALERALADWVGLPSALLFSSGFAANVGCIAAVARRGDLIVSDALNHASLIDGCRLSRAEVRIAPHRDVEAVEKALAGSHRRKWVVTESYFSMDGDSPDLHRLRDVCDDFEAGLIVDEAHALGVFGPIGSGLCRESGVVPDILIGTLGKAVGVQGAFAAGSSIMRTYLWNRARSFVFSTAASPALAAIVHERIESVRNASEQRARLLKLYTRFDALLRAGGIALAPDRHGPIFPIVVGSDARALRVAAALRERGFLAQAIRPPTVPEGSSRLRIALHASLELSRVEELANALIEQCAES